jgi:hypothetical protein
MTNERLALWLAEHTSLTIKQAQTLIPKVREWGMADEDIQAFGSDLPNAIEMYERSSMGAARRIVREFEEIQQTFLDGPAAKLLLVLARGVNRLTRFVLWATKQR